MYIQIFVPSKLWNCIKKEKKKNITSGWIQLENFIYCLKKLTFLSILKNVETNRMHLSHRYNIAMLYRWTEPFSLIWALFSLSPLFRPKTNRETSWASCCQAARGPDPVYTGLYHGGVAPTGLWPKSNDPFLSFCVVKTYIPTGCWARK